MSQSAVAVFRSYPFSPGQKIHLEDGPRAGDWEVVGVTEKKVKLRCPISGREVEWMRFCYFVDEREDQQWPRDD